MTLRLATDAIVVLAGPSGSGKSTWAQRCFPADAVVSSDRLRAMVGEGEHDQRASADAFAVLDQIVAARARRGLLTVIDSTALEEKRRASYLAVARAHGRSCVAVAFDVDAADCRARNRKRERSVPARILTAQLTAWAAVRPGLATEGFDAVVAPGDVELVASRYLPSPSAAATQEVTPVPLAFGLSISSFRWDGGAPRLGERLADVAGGAEGAGFRSLWLMDHFVQIPQVGREWEDIPESWTTLAFLAARTSTIRLGTLVSGVVHRNVAHLAKIVATVDVLSGGRAECGIGAGWFEREQKAYGYELLSTGQRLDLLEDALGALRAMWGPGSAPFKGRMIELAETLCYPRPLQDPMPLLVGGGGEKRTLRLVAEHADACNLMGTPEEVEAKLAVLARHCADVGRDPASVRVTHFGELTPGTTSDLVGWYRRLADVGVTEAIVSLPDLDGTPAALERFAPVIAAFGP